MSTENSEREEKENNNNNSTNNGWPGPKASLLFTLKFNHHNCPVWEILVPLNRQETLGWSKVTQSDTVTMC